MKSILVIGASRGIGLEFVRQYRAVAADGGIASLAGQLGGQSIDVALYAAGVFPMPDARTPPDYAAFDQAMQSMCWAR